jgi:hypothetical protein
MFRYFTDEIAAGGNIWTTADWLVSYHYGFVRRGAVGTVIELLSGQLTGRYYLLLVFIIQALFVALFFILACRLFIQQKNKSFITDAIFLISPLYLSFWLLNPLAFLRKEIFGLIVVAGFANLAINKDHSRRGFFIWLVFWYFAILSHESTYIVAPFIIMVLHQQFRLEGLPRSFFLLRLGLVTGIPMLLLILLSKFMWLSPTFCFYLQQRKLNGNFCQEGGIAWAMHPDWYIESWKQISETVNFYLPELPVAFLIFLSPFFLIMRSRTFFALLASIFLSIPLFLTTYDWGRWFFLIGISALLVTLGIEWRPIRSKVRIILIASLPVWILSSFPYCCSHPGWGGLPIYIVDIWKFHI